MGYLIDRYSPHGLNLLLWIIGCLINMAGGISFGVHLTKLYDSVQIDHLTGLKNRKFFYKQISADIVKCRKADADISLLIADIDNFKSVNDTNGHPCGDKVLNNVASIFKKNVRSDDTIARIGGEEFAIILPNTNQDAAYAIAERIRSSVENFSFSCEKHKQFSVTLSIGAISLKGNIDVNNFIKLADRALYKAKETKNKVYV
jgi:diguanylate cyclase (GGDEF)-like protein